MVLKKSPRKKVFIVTEGHTEFNYLDKLRERDLKFSIIVKKSPETHPREIFKNCIRGMEANQISIKDGDLAYCVFDVDNNSVGEINEVIRHAKSKKINIIISNPCMEIFFLLHYSTDINHLNNQNDVINELKKYIPKYSKTGNNWDILKELQPTGLNNSRNHTIDVKEPFEPTHNGTNLHELLDTINKMKLD